MHWAKFALEHSAVCMPLVLDLTIINHNKHWFRESELIIFSCAKAKFVLIQLDFQNCSLWREKLQNNRILFEYFIAITPCEKVDNNH